MRLANNAIVLNFCALMLMVLELCNRILSLRAFKRALMHLTHLFLMFDEVKICVIKDAFAFVGAFKPYFFELAF
jgi:hypothetical protein